MQVVPFFLPLNIHSGLHFKWFHETLHNFFSNTKEFPDFMTVRLSNFFGKFKNIFEISKQIKTFLTPGTSLVLKTKTKTNILSKFLLVQTVEILEENGLTRQDFWRYTYIKCLKASCTIFWIILYLLSHTYLHAWKKWEM